MTTYRIDSHPILEVPVSGKIGFHFNGRAVEGHEGEVISSALFANGIHLFGHHAKDGSPQGIFCANGQCAQCTVMADGVAVKACMTKVTAGMDVRSLDGLPGLPEIEGGFSMRSEPEVEVEALIIGGGPAGLSAAKELGRRGIDTLIVDDKDRLGGKLVLQTHKFFGSIADCYAGTRGIDIAGLLEEEVRRFDSVRIWLDSSVIYVFSDQKVGIATGDRCYRLVKPRVILVASGAREKSLIFAGNTLPGVYGAGAFQTLVNRDLVRPARRLFIVGGGNVGLIAAYHALQAGIEVAGLAEALPACGGYKVHEDKIKRLGVPIYTGHTVLSANGSEHVESVTIAEVDETFRPVPGTEKRFSCDTLLIAVGLNPVDEFIHQAKEAGMAVFAAGDAKEIAEASSAMFSGRIAGLDMAKALGREEADIPEEWRSKAETLKCHPGECRLPDYSRVSNQGVTPVFHCTQEIPCNPCTSVCKQGVIEIPGDELLGRPEVVNNECNGCHGCLFICPGLAVTIVDYRKDPDNPLVSFPYEVYNQEVKKGDRVILTDLEGQPLHEAQVEKTMMTKKSRQTMAVKVRVPKDLACRAAGFRLLEPGWVEESETVEPPGPPDEAMVCRCERVTAGEIRALIRKGITDLNQIKAITRAGMGACGFKTCQSLMLQLFREEGIDLQEVTRNTIRPVFIEAPLRLLANADAEGGDHE